MVKISVFWISSFPVSAGVGGYLIPTTIITDRMIDFAVNFKLEFGTYTQVHEYALARNL